MFIMETEVDVMSSLFSNPLVNDECIKNHQNISWSVQISDSFGLVTLHDRLTSSIFTDESKAFVDSENKVPVVLPLRTSQFPYTSPTLYFSSHEDIDFSIFPESVKNVLIWQLTRTTPRILKKILIRSGFRFTKKSNNWIGTWAKNIRAYEFQKFTSYQKFNHFPGSFQIGRKDRMWRTIYRMQQLHGKQEYDFVPDTFILPSDMKRFLTTWKSVNDEQRWIVKPPASARGKGVHVIHKLDQIPKRGSFVVQRYLTKPFLINETKFDLRIYVYISSFNPLRIFVYEDGLVRFASVRYNNDIQAINNRFMHLTNYTVNKNHKSYTISNDDNSCVGHKWSLKAFWTYLKSRGIEKANIWNKIIDIILKTIISCEPSVRTLSRGNVNSKYSCHEIFGFDIILDENLKPWLLEVNVSPSLESSSVLDKSVKGKLMTELLNLAGFKLPSYLPTIDQEVLAGILKIHPSSVCLNDHHYTCSKVDLEKVIKFSMFERELYLNEVLEDLTLKDIFCLTESEDELSRIVSFQRIFPSNSSSIYHKFFNSPQYYTNLLDAWESRYQNCREDGRKLLCELIMKRSWEIVDNNNHEENNVLINQRRKNLCNRNVKLRTRRRYSRSVFNTKGLPKKK